MKAICKTYPAPGNRPKSYKTLIMYFVIAAFFCIAGYQCAKPETEYYIIIGSFQTFENAIREAQTQKATYIVFNEKSGLYRIAWHKTGRRDANRIKKHLPGLWVYKTTKNDNVIKL